MKNTDWQEHYNSTRQDPPSPLLVKALEHVKQKNKALDIGGGALKDTRYLLAQGFDVTVIDKEEMMAQEAKTINSAKLHYIVTDFADFDFLPNEFDIASAMFSLPFAAPQTFNKVFTNIKNSLAAHGIFCGQFFGVNDDWSNNFKMTFHTKRQVEELLSDLKIISLQEREYNGKLTNGMPKHWHLFNIIAQKK